MSHANIIVALDPPVDMSALAALVEEQMTPFREGGEWFADGTRWDWYVIGGRFSGKFMGADVLRWGDHDAGAYALFLRNEWDDTWKACQADTTIGALREYAYGVKPDDTYETYMARASKSLTAYAFLHNHQWHERDRLGFFGGTAKTECELATPGHEGRCVHTCPKTQAKIVSWANDDGWSDLFEARFLRRLPPDAVLVSVDYHV